MYFSEQEFVGRQPILQTTTSLDRKSKNFSKNKVISKSAIKILKKYPPKEITFIGSSFNFFSSGRVSCPIFLS